MKYLQIIEGSQPGEGKTVTTPGVIFMPKQGGVSENYTIKSVVSESKTVNVTSQTMEITPSSGCDVFDKVTISGVSSSVDSNIVPENIKKDITILGVTGTCGGQTVIDELEIGVNFFDYDGTLIESWTPAETALKTELPLAPDHTSDTWGGGECILNLSALELDACRDSVIYEQISYCLYDDRCYLCAN